MSLTEILLEKIDKGIDNVQYIRIVDITHKHAKHLPIGRKETHFVVTIMSNYFIGMPLIKRHRIIYQLLQSELTYTIHALSLSLYTTEEYKNEEGNSHNNNRFRS